jgi:hypothetical protein
VVPSGVQSPPELFLCAKYKQTTETPEHIFECADRTEIEAYFRDRYRPLQPRETEPIDISALRPWDWLGLLQGRVHPSWKSMTRRSNRACKEQHQQLQSSNSCFAPRWRHSITQLTTTMQVDHRTGAEPRTVPRHKDPSNASRELQRHARDTITHI